ncbi:hypothetical protein WJX72_003974 [[Myrmecia] bisecta]|uniref:Glutamine amidotransferase type-2 domain-containing protein n=1 Tax=[Myrmecia] bisecta TaxID=41462 RepID=A0AAW1Q5G7_9CHLO
MCRLMAYMGGPILVADVVLWPDRSIIKQSYDAKERKIDKSLPSHLAHGHLNADGHGLGAFFAGETTPFVFTSITPAWNNENLSRLSCKITSPLIFAHVRAAYPGMPVSEQNCHPFQWGRYLWMHNGVVGGFMQIRRQLLAVLGDTAYDAVQSFHSDSSVCFALFLHHLPDMCKPQPPYMLLRAMEEVVKTITAVQKAAGIIETSLLNFVMSDGATMIATRFAWPEMETPASLYYAEGSSFQRVDESNPADLASAGSNARSAASSSISGEGEYCLTYREVGTRVVIVASEPITRSAADWVAVPHNTALVISREKNGFINVIRTPIAAGAAHARQEEVARCLDAVSGAAEAASRPWTARRKGKVAGGGHLQPSPEQPGGNLTSLMQDSSRVAEHRLTGHAGAVLSMAIHDNRILFTGSSDHTIKVWDLELCKCMRTLTGHGKPVQRLALAQGCLVSTAGRRVRIWDLTTYRCLRTLHTPNECGTLGALLVSPAAVLYVGGQDSSVHAFKLDTHAGDVSGDAMAAPQTSTSGQDGHCGAVHTLAMCKNYVCSAGADAMIRIWTQEQLNLVSILRGHRGSVLTLHAMGGLLLSGGRDNVIRCWDMDALVCRRTLTGHKDDILSISGCCEPDTSAGPVSLAEPGSPTPHPWYDSAHACGRAALVASSSADATVRIWSATCWSCLRILAATPRPEVPLADPSPFITVAMSSRYTIAGSRDGVVRLWLGEELYSRSLQTALSATCSASLTTSGSLADLLNGEAESVRPRKRVRGGRAGQVERELEATLRTFTAMPTVSCDPTRREACFQGAKFLAHLLESIGAEIKICRPVEDKNPVVIGRIGRDDRPTVTFYGHYDVQPAMEREWLTDPFEMNAIDGYFYGRGVSDNKGPILGFVYAVKELLEEGKGCGGSLPVNVAFVFEGEEENGSAGLREAVEANLLWFEGTQLIVISNTLWVGEQVPCLTYGMRGMIAASVEVRGPAKDVHSGNDGGALREPLVDLTAVLASLVDSANNIKVPGFYSHVRQDMLEPALARLDCPQGAAEFDLHSYQASLGVPTLLKAASKRELLTTRWCKPTLSVVDVKVGDNLGADDSGYRFGPTRFSVIPRSAIGNVSIRFVPDQNAQDLITSLRVHIKQEAQKLGTSNTICLHVKSVGDWWEADPKSKLFRLAERALHREWGLKPLFVREGGTMPVASALEKMLGAPALLIPFGQSSDNCHLANERMQRSNLIHGKNCIKHLLEEMASPP